MTTDNAADAILACLKAMPPIQRHTMILCRFEQWSFARIAHHLGKDQSAVETAFCEAMLKLQQALGPDGGGHD